MKNIFNNLLPCDICKYIMQIAKKLWLEYNNIQKKILFDYAKTKNSEGVFTQLSYMYSKHMLSYDIRHFVRGWLTYYEFYISINTIEDKFISKIDNLLFIGVDSIYNPPPHFYMGIKLAQNKDVCIEKYLSS